MRGHVAQAQSRKCHRAVLNLPMPAVVHAVFPTGRRRAMICAVPSMAPVVGHATGRRVASTYLGELMTTIAIGIAEKDRKAITKGLSHLLADTYTLYLTTHNFHWNVTGPMFNSLHSMFMVQYTELWNAVDPIAERIRSLGHPAPGSYAEFSKLSSLPDAPAKPPKALEMIAILAQGHEAVARTARSLYPVVGKAHDEPTADLLTQRIGVHEQAAWMLRAQLGQ